MKVTSETKFAIVPEWLLYSPVSDSAVRLYAVLARHADKEGRSYPSRGRLADQMGCSTKTVDRAMKDLAEFGAVEVKKRFGANGQTSNLFHIRTSDPATPLSLPLDNRGDMDDAPPATSESNRTKALELEVGVGVGSTASASSVLTPARQEAERLFVDEFWPRYPRRVHKRAALTAFRSALKRASLAEIIDGLVAALPEFAGRPIDKVPHASTWLNADGWEDEHPDVINSVDAHLERMRRSAG